MNIVGGALLDGVNVGAIGVGGNHALVIGRVYGLDGAVVANLTFECIFYQNNFCFISFFLFLKN